MNLRKLLIIHALITFAAGIVLIFSPQLIPGTVGIQIDPKANLLCYLLGTSEVSMAVLSYYSTTLKDTKALRLVCLTFLIFHTTTAAVEFYAFTQGLSINILGNVVLRIIVATLFTYYGFFKTLNQNSSV